jgi:hypothetical protein
LGPDTAGGCGRGGFGKIPQGVSVAEKQVRLNDASCVMENTMEMVPLREKGKNANIIRICSVVSKEI